MLASLLIKATDDTKGLFPKLRERNVGHRRMGD